ncbi:uncharacterized protein LOC129601582, partial [Paramacrobiotus metropolitanus]|uniref:uncharacterized protein LOC129601582 n=1 Tax=Paramacrobiotus metropolitanus TaxID=2943436 RepID=UPI0024458358
FITDGEKPLISAFEKAFPLSCHTLCVIHVRRNIKRQLQKLIRLRTGSHALRKQILVDIFGKVLANSNLQPGLIDSRSEKEFQQALTKLEQKWGASASDFTKYFRKYQEKNFLDKLIAPMRLVAGVGTDLGNTYQAESLHAKMKKIFGKRNDIRVATENMIAMHNDQKEELAMTLFDHGPFELAEFLKSQLLMLPEKANDQEHIKERLCSFFGCDPGKVSCRIQGKPTAALKAVSTVVDSLLLPFEKSGLPATYMVTWGEARDLLEIDEINCRLYTETAQSADSISYVVESDDGKMHKVEITLPTGRPSCTCSHFNSRGTKKLCRHVIAVAAKANAVQRVIQWVISAQRISVFPDSGNKPGFGRMKYRGTGHTKRDGRDWEGTLELFSSPKRLRFDKRDDTSGHFDNHFSGPSNQNTDRPVWAQEYKEEPFRITKIPSSANASIKCAGCRKLLVESRPHLGLVVARSERDYKRGTQDPTDKHIRHHHMQMSCIGIRHKGFNSTGGFNVVYDGKWFMAAAQNEKEYAEMFRNGLLF